MKAFVYLGIIIFLAVTGSKDPSNCDHEGFITGIDSRKCACCGGYRIETDGESFLCDSIPQKKEITGRDDNVNYPVPVFLSYRAAKKCPSNRIEILCIRKR